MDRSFSDARIVIIPVMPVIASTSRAHSRFRNAALWQQHVVWEVVQKNHQRFVSLSLTEGSESRKLLQFHVKQVRAVSSAVRASGLHPEGRVFKSRTAHH